LDRTTTLVIKDLLSNRMTDQIGKMTLYVDGNPSKCCTSNLICPKTMKLLLWKVW